MRRWTVAGLVALVLIGAVFALRPWGGNEPDKPVLPGTTPSAGATPDAPPSAPGAGTPGAAGTADFLPADREQTNVLLNTFLLDKAIYELGYELNNRPSWVRIPIKSILHLMDSIE